MNNVREPDDESTTYVSAQPGAPLPSGFSEDTIIGASVPGLISERTVTSPEIAEDSESVGAEFVAENGVVEETIISTPSRSVRDVPEELTMSVEAPTDDAEGAEGEEPLSQRGAIPAPTISAPVPETVTEREPEIDREILKSFDPLVDNESKRVHGIRHVNTVVDPATVAAPSRPESVRIKAPQTAQQLWKKNQARRKQQRAFIAVFMVVMAALGVLAAIVASNLVR